MPDPADGYTLLDSGNQAKLERVGPYLLCRPAPQAVWPPSLPKGEWQKADAVYVRESTGGGHWTYPGEKPPDSWEISLHGLRMQIKLTGFGHLGVFPEHSEVWKWVEKAARKSGKQLSLLNLFAYSGGVTLSAARGGAEVCHLDASKGAVSWARTNAALSGQEDKPVRWIVDDAVRFLKREVRRGRKYECLVMDPPSFGRGAKGEVFKIERDLPELLDLTRRVLVPAPRFVVLTCHSPGFTPLVLQNLLESMMAGVNGSLSGREMSIQDSSGRLLPLGASARWVSSFAK